MVIAGYDWGCHGFLQNSEDIVTLPCNEIKRRLLVLLNGNFNGAFGYFQQALTLGFKGEALLNQVGDLRLDCFVHKRYVETIDVFRVKLNLTGRAFDILVHLVLPSNAVQVHGEEDWVQFFGPQDGDVIVW